MGRTGVIQSSDRTIFALGIRQKVVRMENGEVIYEKVFASPRPPAKISLKHDWMKELGSEVARQPEGGVVQPIQKFPIKPTKSKFRL